MQTSTKLNAVKNILATRPELAQWYVTEHGINVDEMTAESVRTYGTGGHGDIADLILINAGVNVYVTTESCARVNVLELDFEDAEEYGADITLYATSVEKAIKRAGKEVKDLPAHSYQGKVARRVLETFAE